MTWINTNSDGVTYLTSAKYLVLSHPTGAPLYNLINAGVVRIVPFGDEFWRLAMVSVAASTATAYLLFAITKSLLAPAIFLASGLVVSQSTIVETYALVTLIAVAAYYLHIRGRHISKYIVISAGLATHPLSLLVLLVVLAHDTYLRRRLTSSLWALVCLPLYLYVPLVNRPPYHWIRGEGFWDYFNYFTSQAGLIGGIDLLGRDMLIRLQDFALIICGGFGFALVLVVLGLRRTYRVDPVLVALCSVFAFYYLFNLAPQTYVYLMPSFAFGAIIATKVDILFLKRLALTAAVALMLLNLQLYDIGRTLDPSPTSATQFYEQLDSLPNGSVVWTGVRGWETVVVWYYQRENPNRGIEVLSEALVKVRRLRGSYHTTHETVLVDPGRYLVKIERR